MAGQTKVEEVQDLTLSGQVEPIRRWVHRANEVLGIGEGDESAKTVAEAEPLGNRFKDFLAYLHDPLGVRLEVILKELHRLKELVG